MADKERLRRQVKRLQTELETAKTEKETAYTKGWNDALRRADDQTYDDPFSTAPGLDFAEIRRRIQNLRRPE